MLNNYSSYIEHEFQDIFILLKKRQEIEVEIGKSNIDIGFDDEYSIDNVFLRLLKLVTLPGISKLNIDSIVEEQINVEVDFEINSSYLDSCIVEVIKNFEYQKIICVSDFYIPSKYTRKILNGANFPFPDIELFVSCEHKYNKRSGRLFLHVMEQLNISSEDIIHIGDSLHSDINSTNALGIRNRHYYIMKEEKKRKELNKMFNLRIKGSPVLANLAPPISNISELGLYDYGKYLSPLFHGFILNILEKALKYNIQTVYFFTREGQFFKDIYDKIVSLYPGNHLPKSQLLEVSRLS